MSPTAKRVRGPDRGEAMTPRTGWGTGGRGWLRASAPAWLLVSFLVFVIAASSMEPTGGNGTSEFPPEFCSQRLLSGQDLFGDDIKDILNGCDNPKKDVEACCDACKQNPACLAFTFSIDPATPGCCWLKGLGRNEDTTEPSFTKIVRLNRKENPEISTKSFCEEGFIPANFSRGGDLPGIDSEDDSINSKEECCRACVDNPDCRTFDFASTRCHLKGFVPVSIRDDNFTSGIVRDAPGANLVKSDVCTSDDAVLEGFIEGPNHQPDCETTAHMPQECCERCANNTDCMAYSWGVGLKLESCCWLKVPRVLERVTKEKHTSGQVRAAVRDDIPEPTDEFCKDVLEPDTDRPGEDLENISNGCNNTKDTPEDCCAACTQNKGCRAFSWSDGCCWLKGWKAPSVSTGDRRVSKLFVDIVEKSVANAANLGLPLGLGAFAIAIAAAATAAATLLYFKRKARQRVWRDVNRNDTYNEDNDLEDGNGNVISNEDTLKDDELLAQLCTHVKEIGNYLCCGEGHPKVRYNRGMLRWFYGQLSMIEKAMLMAENSRNIIKDDGRALKKTFVLAERLFCRHSEEFDLRNFYTIEEVKYAVEGHCETVKACLRKIYPVVFECMHVELPTDIVETDGNFINTMLGFILATTEVANVPDEMWQRVRNRHQGLLARAQERRLSRKDINNITKRSVCTIAGSLSSVVYESKWKGAAVAVKQLLLPPGRNGSYTRTEALAQFAAEVALNVEHAFGDAGHKNIVRMLAWSQDMLIMEMADRGNLEQWSRKPMFHEKTSVINALFQGASGLCHLHANGVVHCDVKPENFVVFSGVGDNACTTKVCDLGIADRPHKNQTTNRSIRGTRGYYAPELYARNPHRFESDAFSFAIVMCNVWPTQRRYGLTQDVSNGWAQMANAVEGKPCEIPMDCPDDLKDLIRLCFSTEPSKRPTMETIRDELQRLKESQ